MCSDHLIAATSWLVTRWDSGDWDESIFWVDRLDLHCDKRWSIDRGFLSSKSPAAVRATKESWTFCWRDPRRHRLATAIERRFQLMKLSLQLKVEKSIIDRLWWCNLGTNSCWPRSSAVADTSASLAALCSTSKVEEFRAVVRSETFLLHFSLIAR